MAGGLRALFRVLAQSWPAAIPLPTLSDEIGADGVAEALRLGLARRRALVAGDVYPCRSFCSMRILDDDGLVAVCEHVPPRCADLRLEPDRALLIEFDAGTMAPALQRLLGLDLVPFGGDDRRVVLGVRRHQGRVVRFALVPRPKRLLASGWVELAVRDDPDRDLCLLTFATTAVPADVPRRVDGVRVDWVGLDDGLVDGRITLGEDQPAYVIDAARGRFEVSGVRLALERQPQVGRLLVALLRRAGSHVPRKDLLLELWPDEFDRREANFVALDRRLRQTKAELSRAFRAAGLDDPVKSLRTRSDTDGGYRIDANPEQVRIIE